MEDRDLDRIIDLEQELFPDSPWTKEEYTHELHNNPFAKVFVYEEDGEVIGFIDWWVSYDTSQIADIGVAKNAQRKGIGQILMNLAIDDAVKSGCDVISLEVRVTNTPAISLYEKKGFRKACIRKAYYSNGENAFLMVKALRRFI